MKNTNPTGGGEVTPDQDLDMVEARLDPTVDVVERLYRSRHYRNCNYVPEINPRTRMIYCRTCTCQVDDLIPEVERDEHKEEKSQKDQEFMTWYHNHRRA
jgi:hypothetical protein